MLAHQACYPFTVDHPAPGPQFGVHPWHPVDALRLLVDCADLAHECSLGRCPVGAGPGTGPPDVAPGTSDAQDLAQPLDAELGGMGGDEVPAAGPYFISRAK